MTFGREWRLRGRIPVKTVGAPSHDTIYEKKSEFIGYISHAKTEADAQAFLASIRKKHYDARHACYAYIIKDEKIERQSDDGEPQKTAGMPILEVLRHSGLEDVIIVVVRYFGGTLLGTGGLVRAYTQAAQAAVASAEILSYSLCVDLSIEIDYPLYDKLMRLLKSETFVDPADKAEKARCNDGSNEKLPRQHYRFICPFIPGGCPGWG